MDAIQTDPLASFRRKKHLVGDLTAVVTMGFKTGRFIYGRGGEGKSFTVLNRLKELDVSYLLSNSRMTAKGLFVTLKNTPEGLHVLEDMEPLTKDPDAQGVLRSALWAQPGHDCTVTWTTGRTGRSSSLFAVGSS